jgi:hypothetical protein
MYSKPITLEVLKCVLYIIYFSKGGIPTEAVKQYEDNLRWLAEADKHKLVTSIFKIKRIKHFKQLVFIGHH